ncbi:hypothetical protein OJ253_670 [Cryptosporidium canis]|uniref:Uncharacterized protein n=1 Tax=Cryptosporidium canis TaxID=195482 RepID=A0A9D5HZT6_9CRYT|nr:hypothetical protein OJ253_670 [Cryptosporidium canis]
MEDLGGAEGALGRKGVPSDEVVLEDDAHQKRGRDGVKSVERNKHGVRDDQSVRAAGAGGRLAGRASLLGSSLLGGSVVLGRDGPGPGAERERGLAGGLRGPGGQGPRREDLGGGPEDSPGYEDLRGVDENGDDEVRAPELGGEAVHHSVGGAGDGARDGVLGRPIDIKDPGDLADRGVQEQLVVAESDQVERTAAGLQQELGLREEPGAQVLRRESWIKEQIVAALEEQSLQPNRDSNRK